MGVSISSVGGTANFGAVSGASMQMPPQQKMSNLFDKIDTDGSGAITQSEFKAAFQSMKPPAVFKAAGADTVWNTLDPNGSGQVSRQNFVSGMKNMMVELRREGGGMTAAQTSAAGTQALNNL